jgi:PQQ-dependent catabolism-associated CXXCW motif protein
MAAHRTLLAAGLLAGLVTAALAQDRFPPGLPGAGADGGARAPASPAEPAAQPPATRPQQGGPMATAPGTGSFGQMPGARPGTAPARGDAAEAQDFGVAATEQLRASDKLHAPTPTTIPGGRVVATAQLAQWLDQRRPVLLLHAIGTPVHLPGATPAVPASQGGSYDDRVQRDFGDWLQQTTRGDRNQLIVTYCQSEQCWGSYNAALRAIKMGYTNVHWYRGGLEAWQRAGLPLRDASRQEAATDGQQPRR